MCITVHGSCRTGGDSLCFSDSRGFVTLLVVMLLLLYERRCRGRWLLVLPLLRLPWEIIPRGVHLGLYDVLLKLPLHQYPWWRYRRFGTVVVMSKFC